MLTKRTQEKGVKFHTSGCFSVQMSWREVGRHSYQTNDGCSNPDERAYRDNDQGQFPTLVKSQQEPTDACGHALNENGHLVSNGIIDFVNIARNKRGFNH